MKKWLILGVVIFVFVLGLSEVFEKVESMNFEIAKSKGKNQTIFEKNQETYWALPLPRGESAEVDLTASKEVSGSPIDAANQYVKENRSRWQVQDYHELRPTVFENPLGTTVKYSVFQGDIPLLGMEIELQIDSSKKVSEVNIKYKPVRKVDLNETRLSKEEILERTDDQYSLDERNLASMSTVLFMDESMEEPDLAYSVTVEDRARPGKSGQLLIRASDGLVLRRMYSRGEF